VDLDILGVLAKHCWQIIADGKWTGNGNHDGVTGRSTKWIRS